MADKIILWFLVIFWTCVRVIQHLLRLTYMTKMVFFQNCSKKRFNNKSISYEVMSFETLTRVIIGEKTKLYHANLTNF